MLDLPNYFLLNNCCVFYREVKLKREFPLKSMKILPHDSSWNRALPKELFGHGLHNTVLMICSQNTLASPLVKFLPVLLSLHSPEHTFMITLSLLREEACVIQRYCQIKD